MKTLIIDGNEYSIEKLDAMKQFHIARRLAPILAAMFKGNDDTKQHAGDAMQKFFSNAEPLAEALAGMTDEQVENIIYPCMAVVKRKDSNGWAAIKTPGANKLMYPDIEGITLIKLTVEVITVNLGNFFSGLQTIPANSGQESTAT